MASGQVAGLLLEYADKLGVEFMWQWKLEDIDMESRVCTFGVQDRGKEQVHVKVGHLVGSDGNWSKNEVSNPNPNPN